MHGRRGNPLRPCQYNYPFIGRLFFVFASSNSASTTSSSFALFAEASHRQSAAGHVAAGRFPSVSGNLCQFLHFRFDSGFVFTFQSISSAVSADSIAVLSSAGSLSLLLQPAYGCCAADGRPGCESYQLFKLTVSFGVSFCVAYHFWISSSFRPEEALIVIFCSLRCFCLSRKRAGYRQHRYRRYFDLRHAARCRVDTIQVELTRDLLSAARLRSPCSTWMVTATGCLQR